ncbi:unnamed protein product [Paramecium sonneborni]|uniref:Uncharacterized protein n=1 Tax=Paramecium sonneborni TaxID=65129 RepID=A0A8S1R6B7_9CILI|nr:unnamed protein product [Paramecium sonneborni]
MIDTTIKDGFFKLQKGFKVYDKQIVQICQKKIQTKVDKIQKDQHLFKLSLKRIMSID